MEFYSTLILFFAGMFGVIIGSFLNVVIYRFGSGMHVTGRSKCLSCGRTLTASMLVPLFSFLVMRGRCAYCDVKLSWQYPLVEVLTGALFILAAYKNNILGLNFSSWHFAIFIGDALVWSLLLVVTVYDVKHRIIPDRFSLLFAIFAGLLLVLKSHEGMIHLPYLPFLDGTPSWINWAAGPLLAAPFATLWFFSGGRGMGLGDAKLAWGIGWFLGFAGGVTAAIFAFWIAFIPSVVLLFIRAKHFTMKSEIPFAPFLVLGTLVVYAFEIDILSLTF